VVEAFYSRFYDCGYFGSSNRMEPQHGEVLVAKGVAVISLCGTARDE
jgi:hypothetical protein